MGGVCGGTGGGAGLARGRVPDGLPQPPMSRPSSGPPRPAPTPARAPGHPDSRHPTRIDSRGGGQGAREGPGPRRRRAAGAVGARGAWPWGGKTRRVRIISMLRHSRLSMPPGRSRLKPPSRWTSRAAMSFRADCRRNCNRSCRCIPFAPSRRHPKSRSWSVALHRDETARSKSHPPGGRCLHPSLFSL